MQRRVTDISLIDIMEKYLGTNPREILQDGGATDKYNARHKVLCPFHKDTDPSFILYDKTNVGQGWDYHCFVCGKHGVGPTMLVNKGIAKSDDEAINMLMEDFNIKLPDEVNLPEFAHFKGLDLACLEANGWDDRSEGIGIKFMNEDQKAIALKVRTKYSGKNKYYFKDIPNKINNPAYGLHLITEAKYDEPLFITEGETDAQTFIQAGHKCIGIPGTNAWKPEYIEIINRFPYVIIAKDNDAAGQKLVDAVCDTAPDKIYTQIMPDGIKDINNFHLFRAKASIEEFNKLMVDLPVYPANAATFIADPAELKAYAEPAAWNNVARELNDNPILKAEFINDFSMATKIGKRDIGQMLKKAGMETIIQGNRISDLFSEDDNCYFKAVLTPDGGAISVQVSNFTIEPTMIKRIQDGNEEHDIRIVKLHNVHGETVSLDLEPEHLANVSKFKQACLLKGKNIFYGNQDDLDIICNIIFNGCDRIVRNPLSIGRINKDKNHWLFGNCGIDTKGMVQPMSADGTVTLDDLTYKPQQLADGEGATDYMPKFDLSKTPLTDEEMKDFLPKFRDNVGSYNAYMGLAWIIAAVFSDVAFDLKRQFPFLFVIGQRNSGKTVFCRLLLKAMGFGGNCGTGFESTTQAAMERALTYLNTMPLWYDDYKDHNLKDPTAKKKANTFLSVFNRQSVTKASFGGGMKLNVRPVNATVLLSGENSPTDSALKSRCMFLTMDANVRDNSLYGEMEDIFDRLHMNILNYMTQVNEYAPVWVEHFDTAMEQLEEMGFNNRTAEVAGVFLASFNMVFKQHITNKDYKKFLVYLKDNVQSEETTVQTSHHLVQFFEDLTAMMIDGHSNFNYKEDIVLKDGIISIKKSGLHNTWRKYRVDKGNSVNADTLQRDISKSTFYKGESRSYFDVRTSDGVTAKNQARCLTLDISKMAETNLYEDFIQIVETNAEELEF